MTRTGKPSRPLLSPVCAFLALALGGCATLDPLQTRTDAASPAAADVDAALVTERGYPRWSEFPAAPTDVLAPGEVARRVRGLEQESAALVAWAKANPQMVSDTAAFAAQGLGQIQPRFAGKSPSNAAAEAEAFAQRARALGTPPPLAK